VQTGDLVTAYYGKDAAFAMLTGVGLAFVGGYL
jgi:hypothetical protein